MLPINYKVVPHSSTLQLKAFPSRSPSYNSCFLSVLFVTKVTFLSSDLICASIY